MSALRSCAWMLFEPKGPLGFPSFRVFAYHSVWDHYGQINVIMYHLIQHYRATPQAVVKDSILNDSSFGNCQGKVHRAPWVSYGTYILRKGSEQCIA